jgi:MoaA/NifB/PqqE/SkfB family radical SAM enzyme
MLRRLRSLIPAELYGGQTAYPALSRISSELGERGGAQAAVDILGRAKLELRDSLRKRFASPVAEALTLKILNLLLGRHHFETRSTSVLSHPFGLVIDPSNICQLECPGCVHSGPSKDLRLFDWPKGTLPESLLSSLLERYGPYAIGVNFYSYGEPLLNLSTHKLIRLAKTYLMRTSISTSLSVSRFDAEAYVESGLDYMTLSIDGATQPVYERFRRKGSLDLVLDNIRKLVSAKRRLRKRTPELSWQFLAFEHNVHEIPTAAAMARKLGVDRFHVEKPFDVTWDDPEIRAAVIEGRPQWVDWFSVARARGSWTPFHESVNGNAIIHAFESGWTEKPGTESPPSSGHTCHWLYKNMVMDATGRIMPCCGSPRPDVNLVFDTFDGKARDDLFNSEKYRQARAWFVGTDVESADAPHCTRCEWNQTVVSIEGPDIRNYFKAADGAFFDRRSLDLLAGW